MQRTFVFLSLFATFFATGLRAQNPSEEERFAQPNADLIAAEEQYWKRTTIPVPAGIVLEVSGIEALPGKRLLVTTRRGEIWMIEGAYDPEPRPRFSLFAQGLHVPLGITAAPQGGFYVAQRQEVTHIADTDGDGRADQFKTVAKLPLSGSYHEYAFGPVIGPDGNLRVTLNVAFGAPTQSPVPWRGWMMEITPEGKMTPVAAGLRSPAGFLVSSSGDWFYAENQGEWVGSGHVAHVERGDFTGHPASLAWSHLPGSTVSLRPEDIPNSGDPLFEVAKRVPGIKTPAVWFPHTILGISASGILEDRTGGAFGPFAGQFFVGDQGQSKIMRMSLEKVKGVWQGASYAFREGFQCGILRLTMGEDATLFVGQTARGWGSNGPEQQGLERLVWTGRTPFEIQEINARPDGFLLTFTTPVDRASASDPANYSISGFTYKYHDTYGSPPINHRECPIRRVEVAEDGLSVRIAAVCLREGYIHQIRARGVRANDGSPLLHDTAYYTLNRKPYGDRIIPLEPDEAEWCVGTAVDAASASEAASGSPRHPLEPPASWAGAEAEVTLVLGTEPGLKFDTKELTVKAGQRVKLTFRNEDDMLHNFVLCAPGQGLAVGQEAMEMGIDGAANQYVPDSSAVVVHTSLLQPEASETIYFTAPAEPNNYDYVCTFPGHAFVMNGILRVLPR